MTRIAALKTLVGISLPIAEAIANLAKFPWDHDSDLIVLTPDDLSHVLSMFAQGVLTAADVESWANALESREDVEFSNFTIEELMHELANPSLTEQLTPKRMNAWLAKISAGR